MDNAHEWKQQTVENLKPQLNNVKERYKPVKTLHDNNENVLKDVEKILDYMSVDDLDRAYRDATKNADDASRSIDQVDYAINTTFVDVSIRVFVEIPSNLNKSSLP